MVKNRSTQENPLLGRVERYWGKLQYGLPQGALLVAGFVVSAARTTFMKLKELQLVNEKVKILAEKENKHFYYGRFIPSTKYVFVGEMPTCPRNHERDWDPTDNFNLSRTDGIFFGVLNSYGLGGSYITDIVKKTERARRPTEQEDELSAVWVPLLAEELGYINPDVVIAVGESAYGILNERKESLNIKNLELIWHPARLRYPSNIPKFKEQINKLSKKYEL